MDYDAVQETIKDIYEFNTKINERLKTDHEFDLEAVGAKIMTKLI
jgi:hypothetical protein